jgi:hypothetical protein
MLEDPFYAKEDDKNENDREYSSGQAKKSHARCTLPIDQPDQPNAHNEQQNERT